MTASVTSIDDENAATANAPSAKAVEAEALKGRHDETLSGERAILTIHAEKGEGGNHAVPVGLNGFMYQIPRAKPWNVPIEVVEVLTNAVQEIPEYDEHGGIVNRTSPRYAMTVMPAPKAQSKAKAKAA